MEGPSDWWACWIRIKSFPILFISLSINTVTLNTLYRFLICIQLHALAYNELVCAPVGLSTSRFVYELVCVCNYKLVHVHLTAFFPLPHLVKKKDDKHLFYLIWPTFPFLYGNVQFKFNI